MIGRIRLPTLLYYERPILFVFPLTKSKQGIPNKDSTYDIYTDGKVINKCLEMIFCNISETLSVYENMEYNLPNT